MIIARSFSQLNLQYFLPFREKAPFLSKPFQGQKKLPYTFHNIAILQLAQSKYDVGTQTPR